MTEDTRRALDIIQPIADELHIKVEATNKLLIVDNVNIGISHNSTYATVMEFIGYLTILYDSQFRGLYLDADQQDIIERYWLTKEQLERIKVEGSDKE